MIRWPGQRIRWVCTAVRFGWWLPVGQYGAGCYGPVRPDPHVWRWGLGVVHIGMDCYQKVCDIFYDVDDAVMVPSLYC